MNIVCQPKINSAKEKIISKGATALSDAELLSLFIKNRSGGPASIDVANEALNKFGSLSRLLSVDKSLFCSVSGLGDAGYCLLQAAHEIAHRKAFSTMVREDVLSAPEHVRHYLSLKLAGLEHEVFAVLFLDNRHRVIEYREMFFGTIDSAACYPREIVKQCLFSNSTALILAHNHPSGVAEPSDTDVRLTRRLVDALALIDVRVLDHMITGQGVQTSLAERGLM